MRDLLFLALVVGGAVAVGSTLMPPRNPAPVTRFENAADDADFRAAVAKLDAGFRAEWDEAAVEPAPPASDLAVARRLALALAGTLPSLEEIRQLEALPPGQASAWYLEHMLNDRRFADYFAERLARTAVGTEDGPFVLYRRRRFTSWLGDQVAANRPYDQIVRELIAGTGLWTDQPATNFVSVTAQNDKGNAPDPVRLAGRVTRSFLGVRLDCAQCHDHPFAAWKQSDFEGFSAFFGQTEIGFAGVHDGTGEYEIEDRKTLEKRVVEPRVPSNQELLPADGTRRRKLAEWVTHKQNPYFARAAVNRVWALMFGKPLVDPVDNLEAEAAPPAALQMLADDFARHDFDLRRLIRLVAASQAFKMDSATADDPGETGERAWAVFPLTRLRPEQMAGAVLQAASIATVNSEAHILVRAIRATQENDFLKRYGDTGDDEFDNRGGTIPQRLVMMNGFLVRERINEGPLNASARIAMLAPNDPKAVEVAFLAALTRKPTPAEAAHFAAAMADTDLKRSQRLEDQFWALINSTEFSWNH